MIQEEIQKEIEGLRRQILDIKNNPTMPDHSHNGFDVSKVSEDFLTNRKIRISHTIYGSSAATAGNYGVFFINQIAPCHVSGFWEVHEALGTDASAVTINLEKLTSGQAPDSGVEILSPALSLKTTINTVQKGTLTTTLTNRNLALGDRLALKDTGVLTAVSNVTVLVELTLSQ